MGKYIEFGSVVVVVVLGGGKFKGEVLCTLVWTESMVIS